MVIYMHTWHLNYRYCRFNGKNGNAALKLWPMLATLIGHHDRCSWDLDMQFFFLTNCPTSKKKKMKTNRRGNSLPPFYLPIFYA